MHTLFSLDAYFFYIYGIEKLLDSRTDLGMVLNGWALTDDAVRPMANLALFSSFSNILFIPPFKKYSWQTLRRQYENMTAKLLASQHKSISCRLRMSQTSESWAGRLRWKFYLRHHSMRPSPSHFFVQWLSARFFMARAYSLSVCSSSQCSRQILSKSPTLGKKKGGRKKTN